MFDLFYLNPLFSDCTIRISVDESLPGHLVVLCTTASFEYFEAAVRWTSPGKEISVRGWKDSQEAARDFIEFAYKGFASREALSEWGSHWLETSAPRRTCDLLSTADMYGASAVCDACTRHLVGKRGEWLDVLCDHAVSNSVLASSSFVREVMCRLENPSQFKSSYDRLACVRGLPLGLVESVMSSERLRSCVCQDVFLDFLLCVRENNPWVAAERDRWCALVAALDVAKLSHTGAAVLRASRALPHVPAACERVDATCWTHHSVDWDFHLAPGCEEGLSGGEPRPIEGCNERGLPFVVCVPVLWKCSASGCVYVGAKMRWKHRSIASNIHSSSSLGKVRITLMNWDTREVCGVSQECLSDGWFFGCQARFGVKLSMHVISE